MPHPDRSLKGKKAEAIPFVKPVCFLDCKHVRPRLTHNLMDKRQPTDYVCAVVVHSTELDVVGHESEHANSGY